MAAVVGSISSHDKRLNSLHDHVSKIDGRVSKIEDALGGMMLNQANSSERIVKLEKKWLASEKKKAKKAKTKKIEAEFAKKASDMNAMFAKQAEEAIAKENSES